MRGGGGEGGQEDERRKGKEGGEGGGGGRRVGTGGREEGRKEKGERDEHIPHFSIKLSLLTGGGRERKENMKRRDEHISPSLKGLRVESINKTIPIAQLKESPGTDGLTCFFKRKISAARRVRTGDHSTPQSKTILLPASDPGHSPRPLSSQPRTQATVQGHPPPSLGPRPQSKATLLPAKAKSVGTRLNFPSESIFHSWPNYVE